jgi:hypothetical protein
MSFCKLILAILLVLAAESAVAGEVARPVRFNHAIYPADVERAMQIAARTIRFALHGSDCGGHGSPSCFKEKRMTATPFAFKTP